MHTPREGKPEIGGGGGGVLSTLPRGTSIYPGGNQEKNTYTTHTPHTTHMKHGQDLRVAVQEGEN